MKIDLSPAAQERLLELASDLVTQLRDAPIHLVSTGSKGEVDGLGVPASCVGHATSFLYQERDFERFKSFIQHLDRLDTITGQNLENPRAQYVALRRVLRPWMERHADLSADECLYVLAWVRRLLPKGSRQNSPPKGTQPRRRSFKKDPPRAEAEPPARGNQMMEALLRAQKQKER